MKTLNILGWLFLGMLTVQAQLAVTVSPVKITGQRVIVPLALTNHLPQSVESARAMCAVLDAQGKMVGQSAKWVIGGAPNRPALSPQAGTTYNFVITSPRPLETTNLTTRIVLNRVILEHGQITNANAVVSMTAAAK